VAYISYGVAWTIIVGCCEAAVMADLLGDRVIAQLAGAAALGAANRIGVPKRELLHLQRIMACDLAGVQLHPHALAELRRGLRRSAANENKAGSVRTPCCIARDAVDELL
jgi:hypothetical protein